MATVRIGDFSGGTSEVLDPSLIAPNAAVASYNLDPRTGVFSPVFGLNYIGRSGSSFLDFIEYDAGHEGLMAPQPRCYVRWGDYLLWSYPNTGLTASAAKFNSVTAERTEFRELGLQPTTAAENASVSLAPLRGSVLKFKDGENNLSGDILLNIEAAENTPELQYQGVVIHRYEYTLTDDVGAPLANIEAGDWVVFLPPPTGNYSDPQVGRVGCVSSVVTNERIDTAGVFIPTAVVIVSVYVEGGSYIGYGVERDSSFGLQGFKTGRSGVQYHLASVFKRDTMTFQQAVSAAWDVSTATTISGYSNQIRTRAEALSYTNRLGGRLLDVVSTENGNIARGNADLTAQLYDYKVRTITPDGDKVLVVTGNTAGQGGDTIPLRNDIVLYYSLIPDGGTPYLAILGILPQSYGGGNLGLSSGLYRYAMTRVDDWGRESAPWPYLLDDKDRPRIDATTEAAAESSLGALFVLVGGLPQVPANWKLNIYRTRADGADYFFHSKLDQGADFVDTVADFDLSVVPMLAEQNQPPLIVPINEQAKKPEDFQQVPPQFLCEYRGTLFAAYKNRLMFGAPGRFYAWPPENYVLLPSAVTGILPAGDVLLVFTKTSTYRLVGNTFSTMDFRKVSDEYGCVNHRTACLVDRQPFWCSLSGVATFDGVRVKVVTDGLLKDNSVQFKGATSAVSYRGEYFLLLTPEIKTPTVAVKGQPIPTEIEPRLRYYLRIKPGAWVTHGLFNGPVTDFAVNPSDGKLYVVNGGKVSQMFSGSQRLASYWKSGLLTGGDKTLRKNGTKWFVTVTEGTVRVQIEVDGKTEVVDRMLEAGSHYIDFKAKVFFRGLSFAFTGTGVVTEFGFDFTAGQPQ